MMQPESSQVCLVACTSRELNRPLHQFSPWSLETLLTIYAVIERLLHDFEVERSLSPWKYFLINSFHKELNCVSLIWYKSYTGCRIPAIVSCHLQSQGFIGFQTLSLLGITYGVVFSRRNSLPLNVNHRLFICRNSLATFYLTKNVTQSLSGLSP